MKTSRIKELNQMATKPIKVATPLQRFVRKLKYTFLSDRFVALTVYIICFVLTIFFSIEL
jgi:hypothetical protein